MSPALELTGTQKVALVLMQMDRTQAALVMRQFSEFEADEVAAELVKMRRVDPELAERAVDELHSMTTAGRRAPRGGRDFAAGLLEESFGSERAASVMDRLASSLAGKAFDFLASADASQIAALLEEELPQTTALVLAHLQPETASSVLAVFEGQHRAEVARALATMNPASPEAVRVVAEALKVRAGAVVVPREQFDAVGGIQPLVDIINRSAVSVERELLASLEARDPGLAEEVRSRMLTFADLVKFEPRDVQRILRGMDPGILALALKGAAPAVDAAIRANITDRTKEILDAEIASMGPVRVSQVEEARASVVRAIRELEAQGEVTLQRGEEDDYVL